jgi:hypothetical protein
MDSADCYTPPPPPADGGGAPGHPWGPWGDQGPSAFCMQERLPHYRQPGLMQPDTRQNLTIKNITIQYSTERKTHWQIYPQIRSFLLFFALLVFLFFDLNIWHFLSVLYSFLVVWSYTDKKENKIFLIYREIKRDRMQRHIWQTAASYMGKNLRISSYIRKPFLKNDFAPDPISISLYIRKILFSFLSV